MVAGGSCIAHIDGKAVFIPLSLPGETLDIEITESKKDYSFARVKAVLEPSPLRVQPPCPLFGRCGGCTLQMADPAAQGELRLSILRDVLSRSGVRAPEPIRVESGAPWEYRSRFQFHRLRAGGIGFKAGSSDVLVPVADCPVAVPEIRRALASGSLAREARGRNTADRFHVFAYGGSLWHEGGETGCSVDIDGTKIRFDVRGFFQSNVPMLARLARTVSATLPSGGRLLDFYSGVGTFSALAGSSGVQTVLVEHNREALEWAHLNLSALNPPPVLCPVSDERWPSLPESRLEYGAAIVDPPRQGLGKKALEWFSASGIPDLRYVSCDPVTFARDAAKLVAAGYTITGISLFDFYPQTHHIETLGMFRR